MIATGVSFMLWFDTLSMQIVSASLTIIGVAILIVYYQQIVNKLSATNTELKKRMDNLSKQQEEDRTSLLDSFQSKLDGKDDEIKQLRKQIEQCSKDIPNLPVKDSLDKRLNSVQSFFAGDEGLDDEYQFFFSELKKAVKNQTTRTNLNSNYIQPLMEKLKNTELPLNDSDKLKLLGYLVQLALIAIDYTQDFHTSYEEESCLSLRIATGSISLEEASEQAKEANDNIYETEKEIRVLHDLVLDFGLNGKRLVFHDAILG